MIVVYRFFNEQIETSFNIPELYSAEGSAASVRVAIAPGECKLGDFLRDLELADGTRWAILRRNASAFQIELPGTATFILSRDGRTVDCHPEPSLPHDTFRHLLLNQVLPFAFAQAGAVVLHASGVVIGDRAIAFLGPAGAGKSTLAAKLGRRSAVLSDDALRLTQAGTDFTAVGSYADLRLWRDSVEQLLPPGATEKVLAHFSDKQHTNRAFHFETRPTQLARIYLLTPADELAVESVAPTDAVISLIGNAYRLDLDDHARLAADQRFFAGIVSGGLVRRLRFAHRFSELEALQRMILEDLRAGGVH